MIINHNITALNTHRQMGSANSAQANSMEKLSSGLRINSAKDDAAGLSISEKMRGQIRGLEQGAKNAQDGISLMQTAEGALNETHDILQRMRELAVQSANDTNTEGDRGEIQKEMNQLTSEINRIGNTTEFNTQNVLDGSKANISLQIGANQGQQFSVVINDMRSSALGISGTTAGADAEGVAADVVGATFTAAGVGNQLSDVSDVATPEFALDLSSATKASAAIKVLDQAITSVSGERSKIGAMQNRLEHTINNLGTTSQNLTAAESRIRDVDYAEAA